jgi:hypothetical protein
VYRFTAELWLYQGDAPWHFLTLPEELADETRAVLASDRLGFGSIPVEVTIGATTWRTSLFPDSASESYVLPVKKAVRTVERLVEGDEVEVSLRVVTGHAAP